jgi:hypothetical protein
MFKVLSVLISLRKQTRVLKVPVCLTDRQDNWFSFKVTKMTIPEVTAYFSTSLSMYVFRCVLINFGPLLVF